MTFYDFVLLKNVSNQKIKKIWNEKFEKMLQNINKKSKHYFKNLKNILDDKLQTSNDRLGLFLGLLGSRHGGGKIY